MTCEQMIKLQRRLEREQAHLKELENLILQILNPPEIIPQKPEAKQ